jgi:hypothetical protein
VVVVLVVVEVVVVVVVVVVVLVVVAAATTAAIVMPIFVAVRIMKTGTSGSMDSLFVKVGTSWVQCSASRLTRFTLGTETHYAMNRRLRTQEPTAGMGDLGKQLLPQPGIEPRFLGLRAHRLFTIPTGVSQLSVFGDRI